MSWLKLVEVLWEVTSKCDKGCEYCGSKDILNSKDCSGDELKNVANQLVDYKVDEVTLTGGEPGMLAEEDPGLFGDIVDILHDGGIEVKVVSYGKVFQAPIRDIISWDKISVVGMSINTKGDIDYLNSLDFPVEEHTMITNFGRHNIWDFASLAEAATGFKCWQVQLTMGHEQLNADGVEHLRNQLVNSDASKDTTIVIADNLQACHRCMAGIRSCGITYNGDVMACLSERSFAKYRSYGNLLNTDLKDIWENEFKDIRFSGSRKCCRDFIDYPDPKSNQPEMPPIIITHEGEENQNKNKYPRPNNWGPSVVLYGVSPGLGDGDKQVIVYGAYTWDGTYTSP